MADLGPAELLLILLAVALIFGGSRLADLGGSLGKGVREFRKAMREEETDAETPEPAPPAGNELGQACPRCGFQNPAAALYCNECGLELPVRTTALTAPSAPSSSPAGSDEAESRG